MGAVGDAASEMSRGGSLAVVEGQRSLREEGGQDREVGAVICGIRRSNLEWQLASLVQWGAAGGSVDCAGAPWVSWAMQAV
jgi:hypothetical protein